MEEYDKIINKRFKNGGIVMVISYKKLWHLLLDRDMKKKDLAALSGVSIATITKMGREGVSVNSDVLVKICTALGCTLDDIMEIIPDTSIQNSDIS